MKYLPRDLSISRWEPFLVPLLATGIIVGFSWIESCWGVLPGTRKPNLLSELFPEKKATVKHLAALVDSVELAVKLDSAKAVGERVQRALADTTGIVTIESPERLSRTFQRLKNGKNVRIAWFGDSFIEGDILVQDVREMLQRVFGGKGVGFVPAFSSTAQFRQSVHHTFSKDWEETSIMSRRSTRFPLGITGHISFPALVEDSSEASWVELIGSSRSGAQTFDKIRVLYGESVDSSGKLRCETNVGSFQKAVISGLGLKSAVFATKGANRVVLSFQSKDTLPIHGISLEGDSGGVLVDNFSFRGNSGTGLLKIPVSSLRETDRLLDGYQLVVLEYGTNVTDATMAGFGWYAKKMEEVVAHLRLAFPEADFLLIGVGDRGQRGEGGIVSNPAVAKVLEAQRQAANSTGCAFWDLRQAMGGENSMAAWVDAGMASSDFTHISPGGGRRLGKAFSKAFLKAWENAK
jgi:hypothetical protein